MKNFIYNLIGLLALLSICVMLAYAAGPGGFRGSGGLQGQSNFQGHSNFQGPNNFQRPGTFRGPGDFHGPGAFRGPGNFHGHGGNSFSARVFIGPGWGPGWRGYPAYPYYPYYPYYSAPPVVVEQQAQVYAQQDQQESDYWYYCRNPEGYYPYVKSCPGGWMKVVPEPAPPAE